VFDLRPGEDINKYAPFDVAVAATQIDGGEQRLWYSKGPDGRPLTNLEPGDARALPCYLDQMQRDGYAVCAWNGLSFDLRWLGRAAGDVATASRVARALFDPMYQFFKIKGFPVGLAAVAEGLRLPQKKSMAAADAPSEWQAGRFERVFEYVLGDVRMTKAIVAAVARQRPIAWVTQPGQRNPIPLARLKSVADCMADPMPDQSWMTRPLSEKAFVGWLTPGAS